MVGKVRLDAVPLDGPGNHRDDGVGPGGILRP